MILPYGITKQQECYYLCAGSVSATGFWNFPHDHLEIKAYSVEIQYKFVAIVLCSITYTYLSNYFFISGTELIGRSLCQVLLYVTASEV